MHNSRGCLLTPLCNHSKRICHKLQVDVYCSNCSEISTSMTTRKQAHYPDSSYSRMILQIEEKPNDVIAIRIDVVLLESYMAHECEPLACSHSTRFIFFLDSVLVIL